jgi:long-subunit fatty acid transport protein
MLTAKCAIHVFNFGIALAFCSVSIVSAAGTMANSIGAKTAGRGGATLAFDDSGATLHDNPAGLLGVFGDDFCGHSSNYYVDTSIAGLFPDLEYSDPQNSRAKANNDPFGLGYFSLGKRVNEDIAVGFGVYSPAGFGARWNQEGTGPFAGPQFYKSLGIMTRILPGISLRLTERLRVGGTLGVAISHVELEGPYYVNSAPRTGVPTILDLQTTGAALTWSLGTQYALSDQTTIATRYQSQNRFKNNGNARMSITGLGTGLYDTTMDIVWPRAFGIGLQHKIDCRNRLGIDVDWEQWSRAHDAIDLRFTDPDSPAFGAVVGTDFTEQFPLNWRDSLVVRTGFEHDISAGRTVRAGYAYGRNPITSDFATTYVATNLVHTFSVGYGIQRASWEFDAAYQYAFGPTVQVNDSQIPGDDFSNSSISTAANWLFLSAIKRF